MGDLRTRAAQATADVPRHLDGNPVAPYTADDLLTQAEDRATEVPDVRESDVPAELDVPVHLAWSRVMADVQWVGKVNKRQDVGGRYDFRGIDAVLNAVGPALRKHGVVVLPVGIDAEHTTVNTSGGKPMNYCRATVTFAVIGPRGDALPRDIVVVGEAFDTGDKASTKAQSVALRTAYINALAIPTNRPDLDTEHGPQYEIAGPKPPTAAEYHAEIVAETTSLARLRQIRAELNALPAIAQAEVDDLGGGRISLNKLLTRVGTERAQGQS